MEMRGLRRGRAKGLERGGAARLVDRDAPELGSMEAVSPAPAVRVEKSWQWPATLPLVMGLVLAIVTAVPYAYAYIVQPHDQVFMGFFYLGDDANRYLAKMRQGWEGAW